MGGGGRHLKCVDKNEERQEVEEIYEQRSSEEMAAEVGGHDRIKFLFLFLFF